MTEIKDSGQDLAPKASETAENEPRPIEENNEDEILKSLRDDDFLNSVLSDRDVSLVYIDRRRVNNYLGGEERPLHRRTVEGATPATRIGDVVVNPLAEWERAQVLAVYRSTPLYEDTLKIFRQQGLLILHGPTGTGKRATAIRLLSAINFGGEQTPLYELSPDLRLADLRPDQLPSNAALLLESRDGGSLAGINRFQIDTLLNALSPGRHNNGLIVVVDSLPPTFPAEQRPLCLAWELAWPGNLVETQREILTAHLYHFRANLGQAGDENAAAIEALVAQPTLAALLADPRPPGQLADLADLLTRVLSSDKWTLERALAHFGEQADKEVEAWFGEGHLPNQENLLIAAAVFNGAVYEDVSAAAQALERYFQPESAAERKAPASSPAEAPQPASRFGGDPRKARLSAICAHLEDRPQVAHYGEALADAVVLDNASWQEAVLHFIWEIDEWRTPLLSWLCDHAQSEKAALRARAAAALGALACRSFAVIESRIMRRWAGSRFPGERRSVAQILGITIWDERYSGAAAGLLHYYAGQRANPRYQWTAALAYAGLAGPRYPQQTLADLRTIAANAVAQPFLIEPIVQAVWAFYGMARTLPDRRLALLREVARWGQEGGEDRVERSLRFAERRTALLAILYLLYPSPTDQVWQSLVSDAGVPGEMQRTLVDLLRGALNFRQPIDRVNDGLHPRKFALDCLRELVVQGPRLADPNLLANLEGILQALVDSCRRVDVDEVDRLQYAAEGWEDLPAASKKLVQILTAG
jgi:hypothetical protein